MEVVAAIIWQDNKFLICQRPAHKARPLKWEFVGGKVEPGETKKQALVRECQEELSITLDVGNVFAEVIHEYPEIAIKITFFNATILKGIPKDIEHKDFKWITTDELENYTFCPADEKILNQLTKNQNTFKRF